MEKLFYQTHVKSYDWGRNINSNIFRFISICECCTGVKSLEDALSLTGKNVFYLHKFYLMKPSFNHIINDILFSNHNKRTEYDIQNMIVNNKNQ